MSGLQGIKAAYTTLGPVGTVASVAGAIAVVVVGASLWSFGRALMTTAPETNSSNSVAKGTEAQDAAFKGYLAQIDGRSLFLVPGAPAPKAEVVEEAPKGPPPPPPPPTEYGGSALIAMVLDTVWFEDGRKMKVGDPEKDDTVVLAVNAPWEAKLKWKGEKFDVPLFGRDKIVIKKESGSSSEAVKTSTGSGASASRSTEESEKKSPAMAAESAGGSKGSGQSASPAGSDSAEGSKQAETAPKPTSQKVVGPANSPSQEPEHPQVVVNKPPPGEKPTPPPGGVPPPPPPPDAPKN